VTGWTRLRLLRADIQAEIEASPAERLRRIAVAVADHVATQVPGLPVEIEEALVALRSSQPDRAIETSAVEAAERLDDTYLELHDDEKPGGQSPDWEAAYRLARAAAAIRSAFDADPMAAATETAYEALFALGERDDEIAAASRPYLHHVTFSDAERGTALRAVGESGSRHADPIGYTVRR
jgi:hypothetical protein